MAERSTEDMGLNADALRLIERDKRLLLGAEEWEEKERTDILEDEGDEERGVDISELAVL